MGMGKLTDREMRKAMALLSDKEGYCFCHACHSTRKTAKDHSQVLWADVPQTRSPDPP